jgi:hypothetical protein
MTLQQLQHELSSLLDPLDIPRAWTQRELEEYETRRQHLSARVRTAQMMMRTIVDVEPQIRFMTEWLNHLNQWKAVLVKDLDHLVKTGQVRGPRTQGTVSTLKLSIQRIDIGLDFKEALPARLPLDDLMAKDGYVVASPLARAQGDQWFGSLRDVEPRLKELIAQQEDAEGRLKEALADDKPKAQKKVEHTTEVRMRKRAGKRRAH